MMMGLCMCVIAMLVPLLCFSFIGSCTVIIIILVLVKSPKRLKQHKQHISLVALALLTASGDIQLYMSLRVYSVRETFL